MKYTRRGGIDHQVQMHTSGEKGTWKACRLQTCLYMCPTRWQQMPPKATTLVPALAKQRNLLTPHLNTAAGDLDNEARPVWE